MMTHLTKNASKQTKKCTCEIESRSMGVTDAVNSIRLISLVEVHLDNISPTC